MPSTDWVVLKFGLAAVGTPSGWSVVSQRVGSLLARHRVWVVVSPLEGVQEALQICLDAFVALHDEKAWGVFDSVVASHDGLRSALGLEDAEYAPVAALLAELKMLLQGIALTREVSPRLTARVLGYGQLMSSCMGVGVLAQAGVPSMRLDARELLVTAPAPKGGGGTRYLDAHVLPVVDPRRINKHVPADCSVVVTQGGLASTPAGEPALLGQGGIDASAGLFGALLDAHRIEVWTRTHGLFSADPGLIPSARLLRHLSYREAQEMAAVGDAMPLHARCLPAARLAQVPVEVRNVLDPQMHGGGDVLQCTVIGAKSLATTPREEDGFSDDEEGVTAEFTTSQNKAKPEPSAAGAAAEEAASADVSTTSSLTEGKGAPPSARILAVACRSDVTMVTMRAFDMWGEAGFLARVFKPFSDAGVSVDLIATSQYAVSVTLDSIPGGATGAPLQRALLDLKKVCTVSVRHDCAVVSVVGRALRTVLPQLGLAMGVLEGIPVHMLSEATEDLNLSFVVDGMHGHTVLRALHEHLLTAPGTTPPTGLSPLAARFQFGRTAAELKGRAAASPLLQGLPMPPSPAASPARAGGAGAALPPPLSLGGEGDDPESVPVQWWTELGRRQALLSVLQGDGDCAFVYHAQEVGARARHLRGTVGAVDTWLYAMKANDHPAILRAIGDAGFGYECVSFAEVTHCLEHGTPGARLVFTPNFCPVSEYAAAFEAGAEVIIDGPEVLLQAPGVFAGQVVGLRIDPNAGDGHCDKVVTSGPGQKFGCDQTALLAASEAAAAAGCRIVGLHAHSGSGIRDPQNWVRVAEAHFQAAALQTEEGVPAFPHLQWMDLGGGLGVEHGHDHSSLCDIVSASATPARVPQHSIAVQPAQLAAALAPLVERAQALDPPLSIRMEPGRYCIAPAGVLLTRVTQQRTKGGRRYVGVSTGMNSLVRPALYGSYHSIVNLSRASAAPDASVTVVGPICESGDVLGTDVSLPEGTAPGDVLLVTNAGAYGRVMSSHYNMREPAREVLLEFVDG